MHCRPGALTGRFFNGLLAWPHLHTITKLRRKGSPLRNWKAPPTRSLERRYVAHAFQREGPGGFPTPGVQLAYRAPPSGWSLPGRVVGGSVPWDERSPQSCCQSDGFDYDSAAAMDYLPPYFRFYGRIIRDLLARGIVKPDMSVLVVCGGEIDKRIFQQLGFTAVTISNLDTRMTGQEFAPYNWSCQDAEALAFPDNSFDFVVVCAGLHHCYSPHRALLEISRVARRCAV